MGASIGEPEYESYMLDGKVQRVMGQELLRHLVDDVLSARCEPRRCILNVCVAREVELDEALEIISAHELDADLLAKLECEAIDLFHGQSAWWGVA
eukprot:6464928-Prymnesium_polylepis.1